MKLVSFLIALLISFSASAQTLEKIVDDYNYAVTVEWDQKDQAFFDQAGKKFMAEVDAYSRTNTLTKADVLKVFSARVQDKKQLEALMLKAELTSQEMNAENFVELMRSSQESFYARGSSWNGEVIGAVTGGLVLVLFFAMFIYVGHQSERERYCSGTYHWVNDYGNECDPVFSNGNCSEACWGEWVYE